MIGRLTEVEQFENVVVKAGAGADLVRLRDVGRAELGAETYTSNLRFGGLDGLGHGHPAAALGQRARRATTA